MSSKNAYITLQEKGISIESNRYNRYETIESNSDLEYLFEILTRFKDIHGNHPVITPLVCVANPDFKRIKEADYSEYFYEPFTETLKRYPEHDRVYVLYKIGIKERIFMPQFHGREHLNVKHWMADLQSGVKSTLIAFENGITGIGPNAAKDIHCDYQAAFDIDSLDDLEGLKKIISDGLLLFEKVIGYRASYFTPPNGIFNHQLDEVLKMHGLNLIATAKIDKETLGHGKCKNKLRFFGQANQFGQRYIQRNALFEPSEPAKFDWIQRCINDIEIAFRWKKPAIISSHRVNFSGYLFPENRSKSLHDLEMLLSKIIRKWPDVEFISMSELNEILK